jgi:hypothetical protein
MKTKKLESEVLGAKSAGDIKKGHLEGKSKSDQEPIYLGKAVVERVYETDEGYFARISVTANNFRYPQKRFLMDRVPIDKENYERFLGVSGSGKLEVRVE